jgi:hypothetical protein
MPKIVKSSSSAEKAKLETLYSPNQGNPKVIKSHEDRENSNSNSKSKSSSKMSFWGSTDLFPGIEKIFIHLSNLELDELNSLYSCKDL